MLFRPRRRPSSLAPILLPFGHQGEIEMELSSRFLYGYKILYWRDFEVLGKTVHYLFL
jgi:hypothetical protein